MRFDFASQNQVDYNFFIWPVLCARLAAVLNQHHNGRRQVPGVQPQLLRHRLRPVHEEVKPGAMTLFLTHFDQLCSVRWKPTSTQSVGLSSSID